MGWWLVAARSATLSKRENKIGVSRTSSVLGGSSLGGDDLDGGADELPTATMGTILPMLGCDEIGAGMWSRRCFGQRDLVGAGVWRDWCDLGLGLVLGATRLVLLVRSPLCFTLSLLFSWGGNHFKVKWNLKWFYAWNALFYSQHEIPIPFDPVFSTYQTHTRV